MKVGERLKALRDAVGLSRRELAGHLDVSYWAVAKYESGERFPDQTTLTRIADFFDVSLDYLLGRTAEVTGVRPPGNSSPDEEAGFRHEDDLELQALFRGLRKLSAADRRRIEAIVQDWLAERTRR